MGRETIRAAAVASLVMMSSAFARAASSDLAVRQEALSTGINVAVEAKKSGDWNTVITALQKPLDALGDDPSPNRDLAQSMLRQAKAEVKRRADFDRKVEQGEALNDAGKFADAEAAFEEAKASWPDSPQIDRANKGMDRAVAEIKKRDDFASLAQKGKAAFENGEWRAAVESWEAAKKTWPESPELADIEPLLGRAQKAADKEKQLQDAAAAADQRAAEEAKKLQATADAAKEQAEAARRQLDYEHDWPNRAAKAAKALFEGERGEQSSLVLLKDTHPSGRSPDLSIVKAEVENGNVTVTLELHFKGGFSGKTLTTALAWKFNSSANNGVEITKDTAPFPVDQAHLKTLRAEFEKFYTSVTNEAK